MEKAVLTVKEVSQALGICYVKALELTERADFPCIRCGRRKLVPVQGFQLWLEAQTPAPALAGAGTQSRQA